MRFEVSCKMQRDSLADLKKVCKSDRFKFAFLGAAVMLVESLWAVLPLWSGLFAGGVLATRVAYGLGPNVWFFAAVVVGMVASLVDLRVELRESPVKKSSGSVKR